MVSRKEYCVDPDVPESAKKIIRTEFTKAKQPSETEFKLICLKTGAKFAELKHYTKK